MRALAIPVAAKRRTSACRSIAIGFRPRYLPVAWALAMPSSVPGHKFCKKFGAATIRLGDSANSLGGCSCEVENHVVFWALWELPWNRLQKPLACPAKSLKTLGGVLNPVSFSQQFPKSRFLL